MAMNPSAQLDQDVIRCLDSCHDLLALHPALAHLLRQGWMDMARARYSMGPSRVGAPLFSLKPHSASARLALHLQDDDPASPSLMTLVRLDAAEVTNSQSSKSGAAPSPDWSHEEDVAYKRLMAGEGDSGSDSEAGVETQPTEQTTPLRWFGAFVSPHLQAAQSSFESALEIVVKLANAQREALHAHSQVMQQHDGQVNLDEPSSVESQALRDSTAG